MTRRRVYVARRTRPTITPGKMRRLAQLETDETAPRGRGIAGCSCARLGWVESVLDDKGRIIGERLTDEGRRVLAEYRKGGA